MIMNFGLRKVSFAKSSLFLILYFLKEIKQEEKEKKKKKGTQNKKHSAKVMKNVFRLSLCRLKLN